MKSKLPLSFVTMLVCLSVLLLTSCKEDDQDWYDLYELSYKVESDNINVDDEVRFVDLSLGVESRLWTFVDADIDNSTLPSIDVTFLTMGTKKCSLTVIYNNGKQDDIQFDVEVKDALTGSISTVKSTEMGCLYLSTENEFFVDNLSGSPDSYTWSFEGGEPATSTDANVNVVWTEPGTYNVSLRIDRDLDGAYLEVDRSYIVGNYPLLRTLPDESYDAYGFEYSSTGAWILWGHSADYASSLCSVSSGGANGTAQCMKISLCDSGKATTDWQLFCRDSWVSNAHLEKGKNYELVFWAKADKIVETTNARITSVRLINYLPTWSYISQLDVTASVSWSTYWPSIKFAEQAEANIFDAVTGPASGGQWLVTGEWTKYSYEFTVPDTFTYDTPLNAYPFFIINDGINMDRVYIDEVQINLIEE